MQKRMKARGLSLLLLLAMLVVSVAVILPTTASAEPAEIDDFGVQTLSALDLAGDADTDLRFVFTVGSLAYDEVGFVFSKSNDTPTVGGDACVKKATTVVYTTITADGTPRQASDGRFWVAVKLADVPHAYFDGALYVRPYVDDGEVRYGDAAQLTVCSAAGHNHSPQLFPGYCAGCDLDGVQGEPEIQKWASTSNGDYDPFVTTLGDVRGSEHFYDEDKDLLVEYSILWNETLPNNLRTASRDPHMDSRFTPTAVGTSGNSSLCYWTLADGVSGSWCKYAGGFEAAGVSTSEPGNPYPNFDTNGSPITAYPNIGGANAGDGEPLGETQWGWHRVSIRYRTEVTNVDAVKGGAAATYKLQVWVYIDGVLVSHTSATNWMKDTSDRKLFSAASDGAGGITYTENDSLYLHGTFMDSTSVKDANNPAYFAVADYSATIGSDFVRDVRKVTDAPATTLEVDDGVFVSSKMWYTVPHAHVPAAEYTVDLAPTCTTSGYKSYHCTICGAIIDETITVVEPTGDAHTPAAEYTVDLAPTCITPGSESKHCTVCNASVVDTARVVPIDPDAHNVTEWTTTVQPTLFANGDRSGECTLCHATVVEEGVVPFVADVQKWASTSNGDYDPYYSSVGDIRGSEHFYEAGNDLLVEYSILWNDTITNNIRAGSSDPHIDSRFTPTEVGATSQGKSICYWTLADGVNNSWAKYAGGFEAGGLSTSEPGDPYPNFSKQSQPITAYPNIGGANAGDGEPLGETQWGWHRVSIRYRTEVTNVDAVKGGADATYKLQVWIYIDGVLVSHTSATEFTKTDKYDRQLFTAASDGAGGIAYTENDTLYLHGVFMDSTRVKDANNPVYFAVADYSATIGSDFVQNVRKATSPTADTLEVESGVFVTSTMWYELND